MISKRNGIVKATMKEFIENSGVNKSQLAKACGITRGRIQNFQLLKNGVEVRYNIKTGEVKIIELEQEKANGVISGVKITIPK